MVDDATVAATASAGPLRPGAVFAGRYVLERELGRGGMGQVFAALDRTLGERVALKLLTVPEGNAAAHERFRREVRLARKVTHRNAARTYDIGEHEGEGRALVERQDEDRARRGALQAEMDELEASFAEYAGNVERELAEARARKADLAEQRRARLSDDVDRSVLSLYDRLLQAREGAALARLDGNVCQGCYMSVPPNTFVRLSRGRELVQCPSFDRILYLRQM